MKPACSLDNFASKTPLRQALVILRAVYKIQTKGHSGECCVAFNFIDLITPLPHLSS